MVQLSRRNFLRTASVGASALFLGLPLLESAAFGKRIAKPQNLTSNEDFLALFQDRMKKETKPGLILVIPKDPAKAAQVSRGLTAVFQAGDLGLFTQAVFVCLPASKVEKLAKEMSEDVCLIPFDLEGKPGKAESIDAGKFVEEFVKRSRAMLLGEKDEKLADIIKAQEKVAGADKTKQMKKAIEDLDAEDFGRRDKAGAVVTEMAPLVPALVYQEYLKATSAERRRRLSVVVMTMTDCPKEKQADPLLPFGVNWVDQPDPCIMCSRSSAAPNVQRYLQFVIGK